MNPDPLPSEKQREMLCDMIHAAFIELRLLGWGGHAAAAADLADAFHNIPKEMFGWGCFTWEMFRGMLGDYQTKWRSILSGRDYVQMLDQIRNAP
jgi:hypothetical protein